MISRGFAEGSEDEAGDADMRGRPSQGRPSVAISFGLGGVARLWVLPIRPKLTNGYEARHGSVPTARAIIVIPAKFRQCVIHSSATRRVQRINPALRGRN